MDSRPSCLKKSFKEIFLNAIYFLSSEKELNLKDQQTGADLTDPAVMEQILKRVSLWQYFVNRPVSDLMHFLSSFSLKNGLRNNNGMDLKLKWSMPSTKDKKPEETSSQTAALWFR